MRIKLYFKFLIAKIDQYNDTRYILLKKVGKINLFDG